MRYLPLIIVPVSLSCLAEVDLLQKDGWQVGLGVSYPVFATLVDGSDENSFRIMSGFNPANFTLTTQAPAHDGLQVSSTVQINQHLQGNSQNSGLLESRVAQIHLKGDFGTLHVGKGFGIFNSLAIADAGSAKGVGWLGNEADTANATGGHIGTGYVYANFNPRIIWEHGGSTAHYQLGLFNPEEPSDAAGVVETPLPRIEAQGDWQFGAHQLWAGFMYQSVHLETEDVDYTLQGYDVGAQLNFGALGLRLAYTITEGIGADGLYGGTINDAKVKGDQWYVETTFKPAKTLYGASYGEGSQDGHNTPFAAADINNRLLMVFAQHSLTPQLSAMLEIQHYESETNGVKSSDYDALSVGMQFDL